MCVGYNRLKTVALLGLTLILAGCSGESTAPVSGKVTFKGEPVKGGTLIFSPIASGEAGAIAGKVASAEVGADGSYVLHTSQATDGAKVGRHRVVYTPPPQELTEAQRSDPKYKAPPPRYLGLVPATPEAEVKPGPNTIDLELVAPGRK